MEEKERDQEREKQRASDLRNEMIVVYHTEVAHYERRMIIMFSLISGFGLYTCFEIYKLPVNNNINHHPALLLITSLCFLLPIILTFILHEIARQTRIRKSNYLHSLQEHDRKSVRKYVKWENSLKLATGILLLIGSSLVLFILYSYSS